MNDARVIPTPSSPDLPTYRILLDGQEISSEYHLVSLMVTKAVNKIATARIIVLDGDCAQEDFQLSNSDDFVPGREIEIQLGYHANDSTIFRGIITHHGVKARQTKPSVLIIECKDKAVKMTIARKNAYYKNLSDGEIIEEILDEYGLEADVETTEPQHPDMVKYYTTDWDFIVSRAEINGKLVIVDDGKVSVKMPDTSQEPSLSLVYGSTMMEFEAEMDARNQFALIKSASWDFTNQEILEEQCDEPDFQEPGNIEAAALADVIGLEAFSMQHSSRVGEQELKSWANAKIFKSRLAKIIGRVKCQGFGEIKPGHMISLSGVGDRFNGRSYVTAVRQQFTLRNWETDIQFGLAPQWFSKNNDIVDPPAAGLLPAIHGLHIGIVTQLQDDPEGEDRVLVRLPLINHEEEGIWARIVCLDAGENRGAFFRPEIGDEVVLGFLNDDPRAPLILGMLNSSAKPAPVTANDDNHEKGFVTRSNMRLMFDDEKSQIIIETPKGNILTLSDDAGAITLKDENSNKVAMNDDGVSVESPGDITIKAGGDVNIEGTNITVQAASKFKAEGSAGAELTTRATCVVKGSLVKIN